MDYFQVYKKSLKTFLSKVPVSFYMTLILKLIEVKSLTESPVM